MRAGVFNIIFGFIAIGLGFSGKMQLIGTGSSMALAVFGGVVAVWGIVQIVRDRARLNK
jgi:hypothetical protein